MAAIDRIVRDHAELFLTVDQKDAVEKIVAVTRLRLDIPAPTSEDEAYDSLTAILGELLRDSKLKVAAYGLSVLGRNQYQELVRRASGELPPQPDPYAEVVRLYKTDVSEFNSRRATEPAFLQMSNKALELGLLR
jgi:hypothetical protein